MPVATLPHHVEVPDFPISQNPQSSHRVVYCVAVDWPLIGFVLHSLSSGQVLHRFHAYRHCPQLSGW